MYQDVTGWRITVLLFSYKEICCLHAHWARLIKRWNLAASSTEAEAGMSNNTRGLHKEGWMDAWPPGLLTKVLTSSR